MMKLELLSPAGSVGKLKYAVNFGANAVYIGGQRFGLRAAAENADFEELKEGIAYAHANNVRVYVTTNIFPRSAQLRKFPAFLTQLKEAKADALIISDMGMFATTRALAPEMEIHISTQANCLNDGACRFYHQLGAKRVVLARELTLEEIAEIRANTPQSLELEAFVHGAMCVSYSGRCLLSHYLANRDSNQGNCAHACRWNYALVEEKRPGEYLPVIEDENGTYIMNSKDMCMIDHLQDLAEAGITSFKIEGRIKSEYYVAAITHAYRKALDLLVAGKPFDEKLLEEVKKVSHRDYFHGFYYGPPSHGEGQRYDSSGYIRTWEIAAYVQAYDAQTGMAVVKTKNPFAVGDRLEVVEPRGDIFRFTVNDLVSLEGENLLVSKHPESMVSISLPRRVKIGSLIRKEKTD